MQDCFNGIDFLKTLGSKTESVVPKTIFAVILKRKWYQREITSWTKFCIYVETIVEDNVDSLGSLNGFTTNCVNRT
jgi:hypothetical protein